MGYSHLVMNNRSTPLISIFAKICFGQFPLFKIARWLELFSYFGKGIEKSLFRQGKKLYLRKYIPIICLQHILVLKLHHHFCEPCYQCSASLITVLSPMSRAANKIVCLWVTCSCIVIDVYTIYATDSYLRLLKYKETFFLIWVWDCTRGGLEVSTTLTTHAGVTWSVLGL